MKPRSWHIAQPLYNYTSTECRVAIFGGNVHVEGMWGDRKNAADLTILSFGQLLLQYIFREAESKCCYASGYWRVVVGEGF